MLSACYVPGIETLPLVLQPPCDVRSRYRDHLCFLPEPPQAQRVVDLPRVTPGSQQRLHSSPVGSFVLCALNPHVVSAALKRHQMDVAVRTSAIFAQISTTSFRPQPRFDKRPKAFSRPLRALVGREGAVQVTRDVRVVSASGPSEIAH